MDFAATFPEASFDRVFNLESVCHAADVRAYFEHVFGLLRDDGLHGCLDCFRGAGNDELAREVSEG